MTTLRVDVPGETYHQELISCQVACPVHTDARGYIRAIAEGRFEDAYLIARGPNPFASICGRVCGAPCEAACRRGKVPRVDDDGAFVGPDRPIAIRALKRFVCELHGPEAQSPHSILRGVENYASAIAANAEEMAALLRTSLDGRLEPGNGEPVAIVGAGPAGLSAAHDLALLGFKPVVFEIESVPAGMLAIGIPAYRLPRAVIEKEVDVIRALGVDIRCGVAIGRDIPFSQLRRDFAAVILAVGAKSSRSLGLPGEQGPGVFGGVDLLRAVSLRRTRLRTPRLLLLPSRRRQRRYWSPTNSNLAAAKLVVTDAFTAGGAQADRLSTEFHTSITWLMTQTTRTHTLKYGFNIPDWSRRGLSDRTNQIGTLSFASLGDLSANRPFSAVLQRGDPRVVFIEKNVGGFLQDEWQLRPNLSLATGLRYDWQNNFGDANNFAPRVAIAYAPDKARKTVIRTGAGFFFDRSGPGPVFDILRFNGTQLRRYVLSGAQIPPDLSDSSLQAFPTSIHQLERGVQLPNTMQFSFGMERQLAKKTTLAVNYVGTRGVQQLRSRDANSPLPPGFASRPDLSVNVLREIESAGRVEANALEVTLRGEIAPRVTGMTQYVFGRTRTDTGGVNWYPANSFAPAGEWGRADTDRRHQFNFLGTASLHRWANLGLSVSLLSGIPFNITTGRDDNRDGMALDRPAGVTRNIGLGPGAAVIDLRWYRDFRLHPASKDKSPSFTVSVDAFNVLNHVNYQNFVGALTSPFYGHAVGSQPPRRLQIGCRYQF